LLDDVSELRLFTSARLVREKNLPATVDMLASVEAPWRWTIAGDGPERAALEAAIAERGLDARITLLGNVRYEDVPSQLARANVYLQPSISESWGLAVNEAMAAGLPVVVSTRCGCHEDLVDVRRNGRLFDPVQPNSLAAAL